MKSNDLKNKREELRALMQKAIKDGDQDGFYQAFDSMLQVCADDVRAQYDAQFEELKQEMDSRVLVARGVRQLTSQEREYYQKFIKAASSEDPKQALTGMSAVLPETVVNSVMDDISTNHPLLSQLKFVASNGAIRLIMNTGGQQEAVWGPLCEKIVQELTAGFREVNTVLLKLSAFIPVCKAMLDLGPEWLDNYIRQILAEAMANGMEAGFVSGDGNNKPIGMDRQTGDGVSVTGGIHPQKTPISVSSLNPRTVGNLLSMIAVSPSGKPRKVQNVILVVNPQDYFAKIMPATTLQAADGTYRNDVMPYPMTIIQSHAVDPGRAILGLAGRYFAAAGASKESRIEYSDHYHFLEDERVYLIKLYANGLPMDDNAFLLLDITGLQPAVWKMVEETAAVKSANANLSDLKIDSLRLSPAFAEGTTSYTAEATDATNGILAVPAEAAASVLVQINGKTVENGTSVKWAADDNTVKVTVTAEDGTTAKTYTVTVTKS